MGFKFLVTVALLTNTLGGACNAGLAHAAAFEPQRTQTHNHHCTDCGHGETSHSHEDCGGHCLTAANSQTSDTTKQVPIMAISASSHVVALHQPVLKEMSPPKGFVPVGLEARTRTVVLLQ